MLRFNNTCIEDISSVVHNKIEIRVLHKRPNMYIKENNI